MTEPNEIDIAYWNGGPRDGEQIGIPRGCRELHVITTIYACDQEDLIDETRVVVPIEMDGKGVLHVMHYQGKREED